MALNATSSSTIGSLTPRSVPSRASMSGNCSILCKECKVPERVTEGVGLTARLNSNGGLLVSPSQPSCSAAKCVSCDLINQIDRARRWTDVHTIVFGAELEPIVAVTALHQLRRLLPAMTTAELADLKATNLLKQLASQIEKGASDLPACDVVRALAAFADLAENPSKLIWLLAMRARECQSKLNGTDIARSFWACAVLMAPVPSAMLVSLEIALVPLISSISPMDVRNVWQGYAVQQRTPSRICVQELMSHMENHLETYKRTQLGECLQYWAQLKVVPKPDLLSRLKALLMGEHRAEKPLTLLDRGSIGPNPMFHPALYANGLTPVALPKIRIPGDYMYDDSIKRPYRKFKFPPRAVPKAASAASSSSPTPAESSSSCSIHTALVAQAR